jgi:hypothetical protein
MFIVVIYCRVQAQHRDGFLAGAADVCRATRRSPAISPMAVSRTLPGVALARRHRRAYGAALHPGISAIRLGDAGGATLHARVRGGAHGIADLAGETRLALGGISAPSTPRWHRGHRDREPVGEPVAAASGRGPEAAARPWKASSAAAAAEARQCAAPPSR